MRESMYQWLNSCSGQVSSIGADQETNAKVPWSFSHVILLVFFWLLIPS